MNLFKILSVALFITISNQISSHIPAMVIHKWEVLTIGFRTQSDYKNPYGDIPVNKNNDLLKVIFTGTSGDALDKQISLIGFWYGGKEWKVNFVSPCSGKWKYKSYSSDKSLDGKTGSFEVVEWSDQEKLSNFTRRGFVRVNRTGPLAGHFFEYSDGTPFLWIGDTWWNWTKKNIHFETFKELVDDRSRKGFNIGQLFIPGNGGQESSSLDLTYTIPDTTHLRKIEEMIRYANSRGITVWIHGWWIRENLNTRISEENIKRWWRYLIHRFGAYNVIWVMAGEYNMYNYGGFPLDFWKDLGRMINEEDPYERIISVHNTPPFWDGGADAPQWSTGSVLHGEEWLDYNQCQVGHGRYANEMIPMIISADYNRNPAKPVVVTEPWYEFVEGNPTGMDIRFAAWSSILSGSAGHTYGGGHVWWAHVPESPASQGSWPLEVGFDRTTYDYEGAVSMGILANFFKEIEWWNMEPHPELILEYPQPFCLARPGEEYLIYLRYGGSPVINLKTDANEKEYSFFWFNPASGTRTETQVIKGKEFIRLNCPEMYPGVTDLRDWVLYIKSNDNNNS
jgi:hypothetical protein